MPGEGTPAPLTTQADPPLKVFLGKTYDPKTWKTTVVQAGADPALGDLVQESDGWYWELHNSALAEEAEAWGG